MSDNDLLDSCFTLHDIYNFWHKLWFCMLQGLHDIQALMWDLPTGFEVFHQQSSDRQLERLAFFYKDSLDLFCHSPEVLLIDATYKVNCFNFPMVNIISSTSCNDTLYIGGAFIKEDTESFAWLLQHIRTIYWEHLALDFPVTVVTDADKAAIQAIQEVMLDTNHVLCIWHVKWAIAAWIQKNLHHRLLQDLDNTMQDAKRKMEEIWGVMEPKIEQILNTHTTAEYNDHWAAFQLKH